MKTKLGQSFSNIQYSAQEILKRKQYTISVIITDKKYERKAGKKCVHVYNEQKILRTNTRQRDGYINLNI